MNSNGMTMKMRTHININDKIKSKLQTRIILYTLMYTQEPLTQLQQWLSCKSTYSVLLIWQVLSEFMFFNSNKYL